MTPSDISAALASYGARLDEDGQIISPTGHHTGVRLTIKRGRLRAESAQTGRLIFSGPAHVAAVESFVEGFWYWTKTAETAVTE